MACNSSCYKGRCRLSYWRIFAIGVLSVTAINAIYSFLSNISSIQINPDLDNTDGINCYPTDESGSSSECDNITAMMANSTNNYCQHYTDFSSKTLYDDFEQFKDRMIWLFIGASVYGLFAIIHDWTLVYYRDSIDEVLFHPVDKRDWYLLTWTYAFTPQSNDLQQQSRSMCCQILSDICAFPLLIILLIWIAVGLVLDTVITMFILPIVDTVLRGLSIITCDGIHIKFKTGWFATQQTKIPVICYVSASWVGIARLWMTYTAVLLTNDALVGQSESIESLAPAKCECKCFFVLKESDFWILLLLTFIFIFLNWIFVRSWTYEATHLQHYPYLIRYALPMKIANQINPGDETGDMMKQSVQLNIQPNAPSVANQYHSINAEEKQFKATDAQDNDGKPALKVPKRWRALIYLFIIMMSFGQLWVLPINIADLNTYNYDTPKQILLYCAAGLLFIVGICLQFRDLSVIVPDLFQSLSIPNT